jgi:cob(I)alamin adenosyltransferase
MEEQTVNPEGLKYLNRLSDLLFVAARIINQDAEAPDVLWQQDPDLRK